MRVLVLWTMLAAAAMAGVAAAGAPPTGAATKAPAKTAAPKTEAPPAKTPKSDTPTDTTPAATPEELYGRIVAAYMDGRWDDLEKALRTPTAARLPRDQQADVTYIRRTLVECRPPWWTACKNGQKVNLDPVVGGRPLKVTYDPTIKESLKMSFGAKEPTFTVSWPAADLDSTAPGEYGFLKGDLVNLGVWHTLGSASAWSTLTPQEVSKIGTDEKVKLRASLYSDFRGNVTALYYAGPPARRWGLHIYLAAYMEAYGKGPMSASRRAVASMFLTEVLKAPAKYPSLKLPDTLAAEAAEEKLAVHFKFKIGRKTAWTIAEDKAFREAMAAFAAANDRPVYDTGNVVLPNKLVYGLETEADGRAKRDAWVKAQFDKAKTGG